MLIFLYEDLHPSEKLPADESWYSLYVYVHERTEDLMRAQTRDALTVKPMLGFLLDGSTEEGPTS
jgi:hypothetical protein